MWTEQGLGRKYKKALYRRYTDSSFQVGCCCAAPCCAALCCAVPSIACHSQPSSACFQVSPACRFSIMHSADGSHVAYSYSGLEPHMHSSCLLCAQTELERDADESHLACS